jgi:hypothetical protein
MKKKENDNSDFDKSVSDISDISQPYRKQFDKNAFTTPLNGPRTLNKGKQIKFGNFDNE